MKSDKPSYYKISSPRRYVDEQGKEKTTWINIGVFFPNRDPSVASHVGKLVINSIPASVFVKGEIEAYLFPPGDKS